MISPEIAVERKALADFVSSVYDGRLFVQASAISSSYRKPYLMVEGDIRSWRVDEEHQLLLRRDSLGDTRLRPQGHPHRRSPRPPPPSPRWSSTAVRAARPAGCDGPRPQRPRTNPSSSSISISSLPGSRDEAREEECFEVRHAPEDNGPDRVAASSPWCRDLGARGPAGSPTCSTHGHAHRSNGGRAEAGEAME